jgi:hypothetical protein
MELVPADASAAMCNKCVEIDKIISHYRRLAERVTDEKTDAGINTLVRELTAKKAALHPMQEQ